MSDYWEKTQARVAAFEQTAPQWMKRDIGVNNVMPHDPHELNDTSPSRDEVLALLLRCWRGSGITLTPMMVVQATGWTKDKARACLDIALAEGWMKETYHALDQDGDIGPLMTEEEARHPEPLHPDTGMPCEVLTFLTSTETLDEMARQARRTLSGESYELLERMGLRQTLRGDELKGPLLGEDFDHYLDATMCRKLARAFSDAADALEMASLKKAGEGLP